MTIDYAVTTTDQAAATNLAEAMSDSVAFADILVANVNSAGSAISHLNASDVTSSEPDFTTSIDFTVSVASADASSSVSLENTVVATTTDTSSMAALADSAKVPGTPAITTVTAVSVAQPRTVVIRVVDVVSTPGKAESSTAILLLVLAALGAAVLGCIFVTVRTIRANTRRRQHHTKLAGISSSYAASQVQVSEYSKAIAVDPKQWGAAGTEARPGRGTPGSASKIRAEPRHNSKRLSESEPPLEDPVAKSARRKKRTELASSTSATASPEHRKRSSIKVSVGRGKQGFGMVVTEDCCITHVDRGGPAEKAGIVAGRHRIYGVNGNKVSTQKQILRHLSSIAWGETVDLDLVGTRRLRTLDLL